MWAVLSSWSAACWAGVIGVELELLVSWVELEWGCGVAVMGVGLGRGGWGIGERGVLSGVELASWG